MSTLSKILIAAAALLLLPLSAYAVGAMTSPADAPVPRRDIEVVDQQPSPTPGTLRSKPRGQEPRGSDNDDDDDAKVRIVRPAPSRVPANVDDDGRGGRDDGRGDDTGDDDDDEGDDDRDDDRDDGDRDDGDDDSGDDDGDD